MVDPLEALKAELERFGEANDAATGALPPHAQHRPRHRRVPGRLRARHLAEDKIALASATFARSGLSESIELLHDDAGRVLRQCAPGAYDLVFLDSERTEYPGWWPHLRRALRPGGSLIVDNATSHVEEMAPFVALVKADPGFSACLVPVGKGELVAVKRP